ADAGAKNEHESTSTKHEHEHEHEGTSTRTKRERDDTSTGTTHEHDDTSTSASASTGTNAAVTRPTGLVELTSAAADIRVQLRYATADNVMGRPLYRFTACWVLPDLARRLANAQRTLVKHGLGLLVWDCYRPHSVQWELWRAFPKPGYVGDP